LDDVAHHPHPHRPAQVLEAVDVVVKRRALGTQLGGQRVDGQRVPALTVQEGQRSVDDRVTAEPRRSSATRRVWLGPGCHVRLPPVVVKTSQSGQRKTNTSSFPSSVHTLLTELGELPGDRA